MTDASRVPVTICWHCDRMLDAATEVRGSDEPSPGAISLCLYCGAVAVFGPDMRLDKPTEGLLDALAEDKEFLQTYARFSWGRQYVMIKDSLMRGGDDPDS